jgi:hypothetical protein
LLYQFPPDAAAVSIVPNYCYLDGKHYSVGSATRATSGEILECIKATGSIPSRWHEVGRFRIH